MAGTTITDVKIVGLCSKCRKKGDKVEKDIHGRVYRDDELSCVGCAFKSRAYHFLSNKDIKLIEENLDKEKHKLMLLISYHACLRFGELRKLKLMDFLFEECKEGICLIQCKSKNPRKEVIPSKVMWRFALFIQEKVKSDPYTKDCLNVFSRESVLKWPKILGEAATKAGIEDRISPHNLRVSGMNKKTHAQNENAHAKKNNGK